MNDIINGHHSEESRSFGSDPHSDQCIIIHVVIMDCVLLVGAKVLSPQGPPMKWSLKHGYDSRDDFISPIGIIAMINRTINHRCDSRDDFNGPFGIIAMIDSTVNHS